MCIGDLGLMHPDQVVLLESVISRSALVHLDSFLDPQRFDFRKAHGHFLTVESRTGDFMMVLIRVHYSLLATHYFCLPDDWQYMYRVVQSDAGNNQRTF